MAGKIGTRAKRETTSALAKHYRASGQLEKERISDEFCAVTGRHRQHAIRALSGSAVPRRRGRSYRAFIHVALIVLWDACDRLCSKRLVAMIPFLLPGLERQGKLKHSADERWEVLKVSAATIDRLLSEVKSAAAGGRREGAGLSRAVRRESRCAHSKSGDHLRRLLRSLSGCARRHVRIRRVHSDVNNGGYSSGGPNASARRA
ncbi:hypothetical protein GA0061098_101672 [Bradyrhizobium shewense]|uniref:Uncharacterized protein n=1 Tax=Bradyrhizobium shewense TaxID=1761772 RepID=A0A1C3XIM2_9BRAD|nr:hypothetical protein GA0061098_101672 [Bradyrhizobium shewense]